MSTEQPARQRILVVVHSLKMGGMERVAVDLADALARAGHDSHLMTCRTRPRVLAPREPAVQIHVHDKIRRLWASGLGGLFFLLSRLLLGVLIPKSHFMWVGWWSGLVLRAHVRALEKEFGRFDQIIFRGVGTFKTFWGWRDPRLRYVLENIVQDRQAAWFHRVEARLLYHRRHLVAVSTGVAESAQSFFDKYKAQPASLRVITNYCAAEEIYQQSLVAEPDLPSRPYILNVARLVPQKGQERLLRAYAQAQPAEDLVIVGDGPLRQKLHALARDLGVAERVIFAGQRQNPYPWMRQARLFVLSSIYEGLGVVLTEALACGTPLLAVDCPGGVRDVFHGPLRAWLVADSEQALAQGLRERLQQPREAVDPAWLEPFSEGAVVKEYLNGPA
nr:glycosyltransferase [Oceanococcus sp. HetDA_MAG_MS8]